MQRHLARSELRAVVFDKDGVLADSESINLRSAFETFAEHGYRLDPADESTIVGKHPTDYVPLLAARFEVTREEQRRMIEEQDVLYSRMCREHDLLLDGARETLEAVRRMGLAVGLATSSNRKEVDTFLARFELAACFDVMLTLDDVSRAKPDPEMYLAAARRLDVPTRAMLVVEDSEHGVRAAKAANAICVAVRTRHVAPERIELADAHIDSIGELIPLLES